MAYEEEDTSVGPKGDKYPDTSVGPKGDKYPPPRRRIYGI